MQQMGVNQRHNHYGSLERKPSNDLCGGAYRGGWRFYSDDFAIIDRRSDRLIGLGKLVLPDRIELSTSPLSMARLSCEKIIWDGPFSISAQRRVSETCPYRPVR